MALLLYQHKGQEITYELCEDETTIGRQPGNSIQINAPTVSSKHALIRLEGDAYVLTDVGSLNGTIVNGDRLTAPVKLMHKDEIFFGRAPAKFLDGPLSSDFKVNLDMEFNSSSTKSSSRFGKIDSQTKEKLVALLRISTSLAGKFDLDELLAKMLDTLFEIFKFADRGCILLKDGRTGELVQRAKKHRQGDSSDESVRPSQTALDLVMQRKEGILSKEAATDIIFSDSDSIANMHIRSMMCVPMLSLDNQPIGAISIDSSHPRGRFADEDLEILMAVAGQAALSYETARLIAANIEKQKQDSEMRIARQVQRQLLPEHMPEVPGYEFFASYDAAQAVGGDYYDVIELADGRICISFGDVAGKGVAGALIMSRMHSYVQSTMAHVSDVERAILTINKHMCDSAIEGRFVTFVLAIIDPRTHQLTLSNAGHMSPLIRHADGRVESFDAERVGPPIGLVEGFPYQVETKTLYPNDMVLFVTDGVDEAMNSAGELYGDQRIIEIIKQDYAGATELGENLLADVRRHASGHPQNDDIAILAFGRTASP